MSTPNLGQPRHVWNHEDFPDELKVARAAGYDEGLSEGACCYGA